MRPGSVSATGAGRAAWSWRSSTGYYAGNDRMPTPWIAAGNMCALFERFLDARFVLMHIAYPYSDELTRWPSTIATSGWTCAGSWSIDP